MKMIAKGTYCSVSGCSKPTKALSYCVNHYAMFKRNGDTEYRNAARLGAAKHPLYNTYQKMKARCYDPRSNRYAMYNERGITVCDRWLETQGFWNFVNDMGERPPGYTLDRIDNNRGYSPDNCRWATPGQQSANTRRNVQTVGVNYVKRVDMWTATIMRKRVKHYLGIYKDYDDAVNARKKAEMELDSA